MSTTVILDRPVGLAEIRQHDFDFSADLETGDTIVTPSAVHTPPSGAAATPTVGTPAAAVVPVKLGPLAVMGQHSLDCFAVTSNGEKLHIRLMFVVNY
jgi:hypothetical protein